MTINEGFLLKEVAGSHVVVPVGNLSFNGMISLNETGLMIWKMLEKGCDEADLLQAFLEKYDVKAEVAKRDISLFLDKLRSAGILNEA